jgi:outer membrane protein OmpA-like peptidoglycan-associated protein
MRLTLRLCLAALLCAAAAQAQFPDVNSLKQKAEQGARSAGKKAGAKQVEDKVNAKLLDEARKNQCAFKSGSDEFEGNCDDKVNNLFNALVDAKKTIDGAGFSGYKFEVSGHTDSSGKAKTNKALSQKRAAKIVKELVKKGIPQKEIIAVGRGSEAPLVKPDNTPEKKAKNRRYEIRVRLLAS